MLKKDIKIQELALLKQKFDYQNFPVIAETLLKHFTHLFDLSYLNELAKQTDDELKKNAYYQLFKTCMEMLNQIRLYKKGPLASFTEEEVVVDLINILNTDNIRTLLFKNLMLVPKELPQLGQQLGYLERLDQYMARPVESLSFVDMLRFVNVFEEVPHYSLSTLRDYNGHQFEKVIFPGNHIKINISDLGKAAKWISLHIEKDGNLNFYYEKQLQSKEKELLEQFFSNKTNFEKFNFFVGDKAEQKPHVFNLSHLIILSDDQLKRLFIPGESMLIDLASKGEPKWAAIHITEKEGEVKVYCEATLLETEKKQLERLINISGVKNPERPIIYQGQTADLGQSSGYQAISWIIRTTLSARLNFTSYDSYLVNLHRPSTFWGMRSIFLNAMSDYLRQNNYKDFTDTIVPESEESKIARFSLKRLSPVDQVSIHFNHDLIESRRKFYEKLIYKTPEDDKATLPDNDVEDDRIIKSQFLAPHDTASANLKNLDRQKLLSDEDGSIRLTINEPKLKSMEDIADLIFADQLSYTLDIKVLLAVFNVLISNCRDLMIVFDPPLKKEKVDSFIENYLVDEMEYNAFIQNFVIEEIELVDENFKPGSEYKFKKLEKEYLDTSRFQPILARNRWLAFNNYKPPLIGDHWQAAGKAWLKYLYQHKDTDYLNEKAHLEFKTAVKEMGPKAVSALLDYLSINQNDIQTLLGETKPGFYFEVDNKDYYEKLITYLKSQKSYFPFSRISIRYVEGLENEIINLINELNKLPHFQQVRFVDFPKDFSKDNKDNFLQKLAVAAFEDKENKWTATIDINGLADNSICNTLNSVILSNLREKSSKLLAESMQKLSEKLKDLGLDREKTKDVNLKQTSFTNETEIDRSKLKPNFIKDEGPWPLSSGESGVRQRQHQHQQQHQEQRQTQRQTQRQLEIHSAEENIYFGSSSIAEKALHGDLVTYQNINALLRPYYESLKNEFAHLPDDFDLKIFFADIISANPNVYAPHIIYSMTQDAAKYLLKKYVSPIPPAPRGGVLSFGLNIDERELSKGLFMQRAKGDELVLCYDPLLYKEHTTNPFTIDLDFVSPKASAFQGDFRQFNPSKYSSQKGDVPIDKEDMAYMQAFIALQPDRDHRNDQMGPYDALCTIFPNTNEAEKNDFIGKLEKLNLSDNELRALGQAYNQFGKEGLTLLVNEFDRLANAFPRDVFNQFKRAYLAPCQDMSVLCTPYSIEALRRIEFELGHAKNNALSAIWWKISELHASAVGFERPQKLWNAFEYFVRELNSNGLKLENIAPFLKLEEQINFNERKPVNMIIWMDRLLACIRQVPSLNKKQSLLDQFYQYDLSQGGLPYALQHEGFKRFGPELKLKGFEKGKPTYAPSIKTIFKWPTNDTEDFNLQIKRLIATQSSLSDVEYEKLCQRFMIKGPLAFDASKDELVCLLLIEHMDKQEEVFKALDSLREQPIFDKIARFIHEHIYLKNCKKPSISLSAIVQNLKLIATDWDKMPDATKIKWLEAITILHQRKAELTEIEMLTYLMKQQTFLSAYPLHLQESIYHLSAIFMPPLPVDLNKFIQLTENMTPIIARKVNSLIEELKAIDVEASDAEQMQQIARIFWGKLNEVLEAISKASFEKIDEARVDFLRALSRSSICFKRTFRDKGNVRALSEEDKNELNQNLNLGFFVDHEARLWEFLKNHIAVPLDQPLTESLKPLFAIFKQMQLKQGYVNEIEHLLITLENSLINQNKNYWHVDYFCKLLTLVGPADSNAPYPIDFLKTLLSSISIQPKPIHELTNEFPDVLEEVIHFIMLEDEEEKSINNTNVKKIFTTNEQKALLTIALSEMDAKRPYFQLTFDLLEKLQSGPNKIRNEVLKRLLKPEDIFKNKDVVWQDCKKLVLLNPAHKSISTHWEKTCKYWLKAMDGNKDVNQAERALFDLVMAIPETQLKLEILHVLAFSTLHQGLKSTEVHQDELKRKAGKLVHQLSMLSPDERLLLVNYYPKAPAPTADDLLRIIKDAKRQTKSIGKGPNEKIAALSSALKNYEKHPHSELKADYKRLSVTRETDLKRLLNDMKIEIVGQLPRHLTEEEKKALQIHFDYLKEIESGKIKFILADGSSVSIFDLDQDELIKQIELLSNQKLTTFEKIKRSALFFQALGHVSNKYPVLAQQFSEIAAHVLLDNTDKKVVILETGEGKSHYNALRALNYVFDGKKNEKKVHIHTAKRTLAKRDHKTYQELYDYLGITYGYLTPGSGKKFLEEKQVVYTITSDFSLYLDNEKYAGRPVFIDRKNWVALLDEIDFIYFEEGLNTEYNFSIPDDKTPEQMKWFYTALNHFCQTHKERMTREQGIDKNDVLDLIEDLLKATNENPSQLNYLMHLIENPRQLVRWIQSAHQAITGLKQNREYYLSKEGHLSKEKYKTEVPYLLREIVPISSGNQSAEDSTFVGGTQPLVGTYLNSEARENNKAQNVHVTRESKVMNSQIADVVIERCYSTWEGSTGSFSQQQADILGASVLRMPTNKPALRTWENIEFIDDEGPNGEEVYQNRLAVVAQNCLNDKKDKKSLLLACENDLSVKTLHTNLQSKLAGPLICFTNDCGESVEAVLKNKKVLEEHTETGIKQKGVGLFASGLGRGDNIDVEAVLMVDLPKNENGVIQVGGRTGRGKEGTVYQIYRWSVFKNAYQQATGEVIKEKFSEISPETKSEMFEKYLVHNEENNYRNNLPAYSYLKAKALFSDWGFSILSAFPEGILREAFQIKWHTLLTGIDEEWLTISKQEKKPQELSQMIAGKMKESSILLLKETKELFAQAGLGPFKSFEMPKLNIKTDMKARLTPIVRTVSADISKIFTNLVDRYADSDDKAEIEDLLNKVRNRVDVKTLHEWLEKWERLARDMDKPQDWRTSLFLLNTLRIMDQCVNSNSTTNFETLFNKTYMWWNKGEKQYQNSLWNCWVKLGFYNAYDISPSDLIKTFNIDKPGKFGFTCLAISTQLDPEIFKENEQTIKSILAYLDNLPLKKSHKIDLFEKIIKIIKEKPEQFSIIHISEVIDKFYIKIVNENKLLTHDKLDPIKSQIVNFLLRSQELFLKRSVPEGTHVDDSSFIDSNLVEFLANYKNEEPSQIDDYLQTINQLILASKTFDRSPAELFQNLLHFQKQCCQSIDLKQITDYLKFLNQYNVYPFFVSDEKLNIRFVNFYNFIKNNKIEGNEHFAVLFPFIRDLYLNKDLYHPNLLAEIYSVCFNQQKNVTDENNMSLYKNILGLNRYSEKQLQHILDSTLAFNDGKNLGFVLSALANMTVINDVFAIDDNKLTKLDIKQYIVSLRNCYAFLNGTNKIDTQDKMSAFNNLKGNKLKSFLDIMRNKEYRLLCERYPNLIVSMLDIFNGFKDVEFCKEISHIMMNAILSSPFKSEEKLLSITGLLSKLNKEKWNGEVIKINPFFEVITQYREHAHLLLSDHFFDYYETLAPEMRESYLKVANKFYKSVTNNTPISLFDEAIAKNQEERIILMQLIIQGVFITKDKVLSPWAKEMNDQMMKEFFRQYTEEADSILESNKFSPRIKQAILLGFSIELEKAHLQAAEGLRLTPPTEVYVEAVQDENESMKNNEIVFIQSDSEDDYNEHGVNEKVVPADLERPVSDNEQLVNEPELTILKDDSSIKKLNLFTDINALVNEYKNQNKSRKRTQLLTGFINKLQSLNEAKNGAIPYTKIMDAIHDAKLAAIESDLAINEGDLIFSVNTKGDSRYLTMLTSLEGQILKTWATDLNGIQSFQDYQKVFFKDLELAVRALDASSIPKAPNFDITKTLAKLLNTKEIDIKNNTDSYLALWTKALAQLNYHLNSKDFPRHLKALASPLAEKICVYLNCMDQQQIKNARLFQKIYQQLDIYKAAGRKSSERVKSFNNLKVALEKAMLSKFPYKDLSEVLLNARCDTFVSDLRLAQGFFSRSPHSSGESRYVNLLGNLSNLIYKNMDPKQKYNYRVCEYIHARDHFTEAFKNFYDAKVENSRLWSGESKAKLAAFLNKNQVEEIDKNEQSFQRQIDMIMSLLPGYLKVIAQELHRAIGNKVSLPNLDNPDDVVKLPDNDEGEKVGNLLDNDEKSEEIFVEKLKRE